MSGEVRDLLHHHHGVHRYFSIKHIVQHCKHSFKCYHNNDCSTLLSQALPLAPHHPKLALHVRLFDNIYILKHDVQFDNINSELHNVLIYEHHIP